MTIQFRRTFRLKLDRLESKTHKIRFEQILPALLAAVVRTGTYLDVEDLSGREVLNGIFAAAIEKAGVLIDHFRTKSTKINAVRLIANTKELDLDIRWGEYFFLGELETYTEFPHLKRFCCGEKELAVAILARSQLEYFATET